MSTAIAISPAAGQQRSSEDPAFATLCAHAWSVGPIWAGEALGCPPVVQPLPPSDRPCRRTYSTSEDTREAARLRYDAAGRLARVETAHRARSDYAYDAEGRLTTHTRTRPGFESSTTTYAYTPGERPGEYAISDDDSSQFRHRWQVQAGFIRSSMYLSGASPVSNDRALLEDGVFVGVEIVLCRTPSSDGACDPAGPPIRSMVARDRRGRIERWTTEDLTTLYTYDSRGRLIRVRSSNARTRDETRLEYVCTED